jgi:hypothetical protein
MRGFRRWLPLALLLMIALPSLGCSRCACIGAEEERTVPDVREARAGTERQADPYVPVVSGLDLEETLAVGDLLVGLDAGLDGHSFTIAVLVRRSQAREAYLRILSSPYRGRGSLREWKD